MILLAKGFEGQLDISGPEELGQALTKVFRRSVVAGQVIEVPDEYYQFPNIRSAIKCGLLEILDFDGNPESHVINAELEEILKDFTPGGGGTGTAKEEITQPGHGLLVGQAVYVKSDGDFAPAKADDFVTAEVAGIIEEVIDSDTFVIVYAGAIEGLSGLTTGGKYYLSDTTAGALVLGEPGCALVTKPLLIAKSTTDGIVTNQLGQKPDDANAGRDWMGL
jgi:hypothetical protein